jgi:N,N'-diacetyllegionaminate synthase
MIIAEIAQAHEGSLGIAHSYIDALRHTGVDVIKFQVHIAEAESSAFEPFRVRFSYEDETRYDYWKRMEFTSEQWAGLKKHCEDAGVEFLASPFSNAAVALLEKLQVKRYKVGSGEITNSLMMEKIARTGKPVLLSSGMSSLDELDRCIALFTPYENHLSVFQCTTAYPTTPQQWGLEMIAKLKSRYGLPVGFSDHSGAIYACLAASSLGADLLEFHVVFDKAMFGPDAKASLTIQEVKQLVEGVRQIREALSSPVDKTANTNFSELKSMFEKSLAINKNIPAGHVLQEEDLEAKKPKGYGIPATDFKQVIGKPVTRSLKQFDFISYQDIETVNNH